MARIPVTISAGGIFLVMFGGEANAHGFGMVNQGGTDGDGRGANDAIPSNHSKDYGLTSAVSVIVSDVATTFPSVSLGVHSHDSGGCIPMRHGVASSFSMATFVHGFPMGFGGRSITTEPAMLQPTGGVITGKRTREMNAPSGVVTTRKPIISTTIQVGTVMEAMATMLVSPSSIGNVSREVTRLTTILEVSIIIAVGFAPSNVHVSGWYVHG